jgi:hypothetical protein
MSVCSNPVRVPRDVRKPFTGAPVNRWYASAHFGTGRVNVLARFVNRLDVGRICRVNGGNRADCNGINGILFAVLNPALIEWYLDRAHELPD